MKITLKIEKGLWFPSYGWDLIRMSYRSVDEYSPRQPPTSRDPKFSPKVTPAEPHKVGQTELSDFNRDLELSKNKAEPLFF